MEIELRTLSLTDNAAVASLFAGIFQRAGVQLALYLIVPRPRLTR